MPIPAAAQAALIASGSDIFQNILGNVAGKKNTDDARKFAIKMWNMQNAYDSPAEQRKRMELAGFNPNLVYGNGSVANTSSNVEQPPPMELKAPQIGGAISTYIQTKQQQEQVEIMKAQLANIKADTIKKSMESTNIDAQTKTTGFHLDKDKAWYNTNSDLLKAELQKLTLQNEGSVTDNAQKVENLKTTALQQKEMITRQQGLVLDNIGKRFENQVKQAMGKYADQHQIATITKMNADMQSAIASRNKSRIETKIAEFEEALTQTGTSVHDSAPYRILLQTLNHMKRKLNPNYKPKKQKDE